MVEISNNVVIASVVIACVIIAFVIICVLYYNTNKQLKDTQDKLISVIAENEKLKTLDVGKLRTIIYFMLLNNTVENVIKRSIAPDGTIELETKLAIDRIINFINTFANSDTFIDAIKMFGSDEIINTELDKFTGLDISGLYNKTK